MTTITIDELRERLDEVIDQLAQGGEPVAVTRDGVAVAEINPSARAIPSEAGSNQTGEWTDEQWDAYWDARRDTLAAEIGAAWPAGVSAVDAIREDRSRLDDFLARNDDRGEEL